MIFWKKIIRCTNSIYLNHFIRPSYNKIRLINDLISHRAVVSSLFILLGHFIKDSCNPVSTLQTHLIFHIDVDIRVVSFFKYLQYVSYSNERLSKKDTGSESAKNLLKSSKQIFFVCLCCHNPCGSLKCCMLIFYQFIRTWWYQ